MTPLLQAKGIEKHYAGISALQGVDMTIEPGRIIGLLGPNASGKTTLMKTIAGLLQPDFGEIVYPNGAQRGSESKKTIALLPDNLTFPGWMRVKDAFGFYRDMYPDFSEERAASMIGLLELEPVMNRPVKRLSKGIQERVALGLTLSRNTQVYLLDEPLGGIDPVGKARIIDAILSMQLENCAIVVSTHLVKDVERIFDSVYFLSGGKIVYRGDCDAMRGESGKTVEQAYLEVFINEGAI